jgi:hypothetical protein
MKECSLAHFDRFLPLNADQIPTPTEYFTTFTQAIVFIDPALPTMQNPALAQFHVAKYLTLAFGAFDRKHKEP